MGDTGKAQKEIPVSRQVCQELFRVNCQQNGHMWVTLCCPTRAGALGSMQRRR